jgi:hypothetical protein
MFKHRHGALRGCAECDRIYELGKTYQRGMQQAQPPVINPVDYMQDQINFLQAELGKARLKIDVYEKMFNALRIPVLPKEN